MILEKNFYFIFQKTNLKFSKMAFDQMNVQNNKNIKCYGGAKHLLNKSDESGLIRSRKIEI